VKTRANRKSFYCVSMERAEHMQLQLARTLDDAVQAGYACSCGCKPSVTYEKGGANVDDVCCCGTHFVVGKDAESDLKAPDDARIQVQEIEAPWGEVLEAAWAIGSGTHEHKHEH
jgi:hypothetical protein